MSLPTVDLALRSQLAIKKMPLGLVPSEALSLFLLGGRSQIGESQRSSFCLLPQLWNYQLAPLFLSILFLPNRLWESTTGHYACKGKYFTKRAVSVGHRFHCFLTTAEYCFVTKHIFSHPIFIEIVLPVLFEAMLR